ncbi:BREX-1 system phosphatase PglZ type A [Actinomyces sp. B33]|uniref:BREX-1 system phosphatase PglZ type A n=1 Tax=Actinomyces sp. B33 TaxID=2942131 RepID=UPI00233FCE75|nr:BREX-1 system phosphatase PglZ type A [Actinomyces sp. B33]MDC4232433.1 BREX-1 system phosphatase PglZ type A [Actinomyces sp. B33]
MSGEVAQHLRERLAQNRIVFWHDSEGEYENELDGLDLDGVNIIRVDGDEFGIKHRLLSDSKGAYLVYRPGTTPVDTQNWLLDLELAYDVFTADKTAMLQRELGINNPALLPVIDAHQKFFGAARRRKALEDLLARGDDPARMRAKMCQVLIKSSGHKLTDIVRELLIDYANGSTLKFDELAVFGLDDFFWAGLKNIYGYESSTPTIDDFILWVFRLAVNDFAADDSEQYRNIRSDFYSLRYDTRAQDTMRKLASRAADQLDIASSLDDIDFRDLIEGMIFKEIDQRIIVGLADAIADRTMTRNEVAELIVRRKESLWYDQYKGFYLALLDAVNVLAMISAMPESIASIAEGLEKYQSEWFMIDQLYRRFTTAYRMLENPHPLEGLKAEVDKQYANRFLFGLGQAWQQVLDTMSEWKTTALPKQSLFYKEKVAPLISGGRNKAVVIISDALRYEIADEFASRIRSEDRFSAILSARFGALPSYTQLGMAALLPHETLELTPEGLPVLVDGKPSNGTANRDKILKTVDGCALQATDILNMNGSEMRELYKSHTVFFVYHNRIDAAGDKPASESTVFEAADDAIRELVRLVKKWTNANATNIFVTADHGFLYQDVPLEDAYYLSDKAQGEHVTMKNRRFVLGEALAPSSSFMTFTSEQAGLSGDVEIQIPKSIHRLRMPGPGSRYVHGGASLQEIVVPVVAINKKRTSDTRPVAVDLMPETDKITTGQLAVKLAQREAVTDKIHARRVRLGLYVGEVLISDTPILTFESTSEEPRDRYQSTVLHLTQEADDFNLRPVELRLEEPIPNTTQWKTFSKANYMLRRSFTTDFDF